MVEIKNVDIIYNKGMYNEKKALDNFSLKIEKNEFITIIGHNGAGKTTLFKVLTGSLTPDSGKYIINGREIKKVRSHILFKKIGIVYQNPDSGVFPELTIEENLILGKKRGMRGLGFSKYDSLDLLAGLGIGLEKRLKAKVKELSGGQKQSLAMIIAVSSKPSMLLLDEHTAALDPKMADKIMNLTLKINKELNIPVLMITHNMNLTEKYSQRIIEISGGKISSDIFAEENSSSGKIFCGKNMFITEVV